MERGRGRGHAVVLGGSLAGLAAAGALVRRFERVTLVDRDRFPEEPRARPGAPQARHVHILLRAGQQALEELFPGLAEDLRAGGAESIDTGADLLWRTPAGDAPRFASGLTKLACSRDLLEWCVRRQLLSSDRVALLDGWEALELVPTADGAGVAGVQLRSRNHAGRERVLRADLVVDASGVHSRAPVWLARLGFAPPRETRVDPRMGYASRIYRRPAGERDWKALYVQPAAPRETRYGVLFPIEGERWLVSLGGVAGDHPPTDEAGFLRFAASLPTPRLHEAIRGAQPLTRISGYRGGGNRLRHWEELRRWPEGLVILGDAVATFTPVYGQGMTVAALGARALGRRLDAGPLDAAAGRGFQRQLARIVSLPWALATAEDLRYPSTAGPRVSAPWRALQRWGDAALWASLTDLAVRHLLLELQHMTRHPAALLRPDVAWRILRRGLRRGRPRPAGAALAPEGDARRVA